jgi:diguanylate cyclase (GGDEF)-like protein
MTRAAKGSTSPRGASVAPRERDGANPDETLAAAEQTGAGADQSLSDSDQNTSEHDQISSDRDQAAADIDQAASDGKRSDSGLPAEYERTRRMRADSTLERHTTTETRSTVAALRDRVSERRDGLAAARDIASAARDQLAATLDNEIERLERKRSPQQNAQSNGGRAHLRAALERRMGAESRARAALQRQAAADDRANAARDRQHAALDRMAYAHELAAAAIDEMTGALRRGVGLVALQREMDRTRRTEEQMIVAFIDVDGLKAVNDRDGHPAGDVLLQTVVGLVTEEFRSYDLMLRFGGDEFVCSFSGDGLDEIGKRFERVSARLSQAAPGASISVGVTERRAEDTIERLLDRADAQMIATRRCHRRVEVATLNGKFSAADEARRSNNFAE